MWCWDSKPKGLVHSISPVPELYLNVHCLPSVLDILVPDFPFLERTLSDSLLSARLVLLTRAARPHRSSGVILLPCQLISNLELDFKWLFSILPLSLYLKKAYLNKRHNLGFRIKWTNGLLNVESTDLFTWKVLILFS